MLHHEILEDLSNDCPCNGNNKWCFWRDFGQNLGWNDRNAEQVRLIYHYKWLESEKEGKDIGWERAYNGFSKKYAKKFAKVYKEGMKFEELKDLLFPPQNLSIDKRKIVKVN